MTSQDWEWMGWIWVVGLAVLGIGILVAPAVDAFPAGWVQPGQGTALLLIAASILFAAVFPALATGRSRLISIASALTALFGYAGTIVILAGENTLLLAIVVAYTIYLALTAYFIVSIFRLIGYIIARLR